MTTRFHYYTQKRYGMINTVTFRIIARAHGNNGSISLNAQCFVNKQRVVIPLSIYIESKFFDDSAQLIKPQHPLAMQYNAIISNARERAVRVLSEANKKDLYLSRDSFRAKFIHTVSDMDFCKFWEDELERRRGAIERSTWKQQQSSLKKFKQFRNVLPFDMINAGLIDEYETYLRRKGNNTNTISAAMKNFKTYINHAIKRGIEIKNPFQHYRIKQVSGRLVYLSKTELHTLLQKYNSQELPAHLNETLLVFLVQSFTSLRISDVKNISPSWIKTGELEFTPYKTRKYQKVVRFGLSNVASALISDLFKLKKVKRLKTEQRINDDLKLIAAHCGINKPITTHVARHTFATTFIYLGGDVVTLKDIMGHGRIETTMKYVKVIDTKKTEQMGNFDNEFKYYASKL